MAADPLLDLVPGRPHPARMYDYYLGGKDNYAADVAAAEKVMEAFPAMPVAARANRAFMHRAVRWLATEAGIRQFLDIGTGIPTEPNLHQVAQQAAPESRVVYVDNDPIVLLHAQALMASTPQGRTAYVHADVTRPESILNAPEVAEALDMSRPVALSLVALLHLIPDEQNAYGIVERLLSPLPSGSALVISHGTEDFAPEAMRTVTAVYHSRDMAMQMRSKAEIERFFAGMDLVAPGISLPHRWRPGVEAGSGFAAEDAAASAWAAVAVKP